MLNFSKNTKRAVLTLLFAIVMILLPGRFVLPQIPVVGPYFTSFYQYMDAFSFLKGKKWGFARQDIYYPEGKSTYPKDAVKTHFEERKIRFVLLSDDVTLYVSPTQNTVETARLPAGTRVRATYSLPDESWSFVIDPVTLAPLGWCLDKPLGYKERFSRVNEWGLPDFGMCIGEYCAEFHISSEGAFDMSWEAIGQGLQLSGTGYGQLYEYRGLVWFKQENSANLDELMLSTPEGGVKHEVRRQKEPLRLSKKDDQSLRNIKKSVFSF